MEAMLTAMHYPTSVMRFGVRATADAAPSHPTSAMAALMHHGRAAYARRAMISSEEVAGWFTRQMQIGNWRTCSFLERIGAGFFAPDNTQPKTKSSSHAADL